MYRQLRTQADGLCGNLDKVWPDIKDSGWTGGEKEGWERVPYWLDGFIPMAWLLDDSDLKACAVKYINAILSRQQEDGWICPCDKEERPRYDIWAAFLICKVLVVYYQCTEDARIEQAVYKALKCISRHLEVHTLFDWGASRWFECLIPLGWLYDRHPESWMQDLAVLLRVQGVDYEKLFENWPYRKPQEKGRWNYLTHVVNLSMCLRSDMLYNAFEGREIGNFAEKALNMLLDYHGMPIGHFSGDECLAGKSPLNGTELCGIVEAMYSYEWLLCGTGRDIWADHLESLAFNALPATISSDMWTHQYDQMSNQIQCSILSPENTPFLTNNGESHIFGLEPNYGCCTANFGQGWPKLAMSAILVSKKGIAVGTVLPCSANLEIEGTQVYFRIVTNYPFEDGYRIIVQTAHPAEFEISLRIPGEAAEAYVDGEKVEGNRCTLRRRWEGKSEINVVFDFEAKLQPQYEDMYYVKRGPLVFSLPVKAQWRKKEYVRDGVERRYPYCDYELFPESAWNFAFADGKFMYNKKNPGIGTFDSQNPPVCLKTTLCPVEWPVENGVTAIRPSSLTPVGPEVEAELVPYGCTDLRMTVMPVAEPYRKEI